MDKKAICDRVVFILRKAINCAFLILAMSSENDWDTCLVGLTFLFLSSMDKRLWNSMLRQLRRL